VSCSGAVRQEYEALARDFGVLAAQFGVTVDDALQRDLVLVAAAFETVDRHVDTTPCAVDRARLCAAITRSLREGHTEGLLCGNCADLAPTLIALRSRLLALSALEAFVVQVDRFFVRSEELRLTQSGAEFVRCVLDEARCAGKMTLLLILAAGSTRFPRFFLVLSQIANLVDKLHDVRGDWARGEIAVRPSFGLHLRLLTAFAIRLPELFLLSTRPFRLVVWGVRFVLPAPHPARTVSSPAPRVSRTANQVLANRQ
jgi:hypothetical protein